MPTAATSQFQYVKLPDGSYGKFRADATDAQIRQQVEKDFPAAYKPTQPSAASRFASSAADSSGLTMVGNVLRHPMDTVGTVVDAARRVVSPGQPANMSDNPNPIISEVGKMVDSTVDNAREAWKAARSRNPAGAVSYAISAIPVVGPLLDKAEGQYAQGDIAGEMGTLTGGAAALAVPARSAVRVAGGGESLTEAANTGATIARRFPGAVGQGKEAFLQSTYRPTSQSIVPRVAAARNLAKALVVSPQAMDGFVSSAADEAGTILDHAKRKGIRINSTVDFANAAKSASSEIRDFYNQKVLGPNKDRAVSVKDIDYRGKGLDGGRATLGHIDQRINAINQELNPNYRKALPSQTSAANVSDADLIAEKRALTDVLHKSLGDMNGIDPQDVADLRQRAGKLKTIAEESQLSANTDTTAAGKAARGRSDVPVNTLGLAKGAWMKARGGPEIMGNKALKSAIADIEHQNTPFPELNPPETSGPAADAQREAARQEALHAAALEQAAQDAAASRGATAANTRTENVAADQQQRLAEGAAVRNAGQARAIQTPRGAPAPTPNVAAPAEDAAQPTVGEKEVIAPDPSRGVQSVTLPVVEPPADAAPSPDTPSQRPTHPAGDVTAFDETTGLPIVKRGATETVKPSPSPGTSPHSPEGTQAAEPTAATHVFSTSQWQAVNPGGDVNAAAKAAADEGYEVQP